MAEEEKKDAKDSASVPNPSKKPRRARTPKEADAETAESTEDEDATAAAEEPEALADHAPEAEAAAEETDKASKPARRGSAETSTATAEHATSEAPRDADGKIVVKASARYVRSAPRKARLVMDHIRGKRVQDAVAMLNHTPRAASRDVLKLLNSAVANAENNHELAPDDLRVHRATVDEGPTIKRYQPRAQGRATQILKRTSHMTITLTTENEE